MLTSRPYNLGRKNNMRKAGQRRGQAILSSSAAVHESSWHWLSMSSHIERFCTMICPSYERTTCRLFLFPGFPNPISWNGEDGFWMAPGRWSMVHPPEGRLRSFKGSGSELSYWQRVLLLSTVQNHWWNMKKPVQKFFSDITCPSDLEPLGIAWRLSSSSSHIFEGSMTIIQVKDLELAKICAL